MRSIRDVLADMGLVRRPPEPHEFETAMHMLFNPAAGTVGSTPNIVTPPSSAGCARDGCDRPRDDAIHRIAEA
jgi:hypothetical protein